MDQVKDTLKKNTAILDPYGAMVPAFVDLSAKADVNPGLIVAAIGSVASLIIMILILILIILVMFSLTASFCGMVRRGRVRCGSVRFGRLSSSPAASDRRGL